jgi:hypothetical protein
MRSVWLVDCRESLKPEGLFSGEKIDDSDACHETPLDEFDEVASWA